MSQRIPEDTESFLKMLDERHPHRCPDPRHDERKIWMDVGARRLIDTYLQHWKKQNDV